MQVFLAGTPVTVQSEFFDRSGNPLEVASATYRVLGHAGEELQAEVVLFGDGVEVITPKQPEPPTPDVPADQGQEQTPPTEEVQPDPEPEQPTDPERPVEPQPEPAEAEPTEPEPEPEQPVEPQPEPTDPVEPEPVEPEPQPEPEPTEPEILPGEEGLRTFSLYGGIASTSVEAPGSELVDPAPALEQTPEAQQPPFEGEQPLEVPPAVMPTSVTIPAELNVIAALDPDSIESGDMDAVSVRELRTVEFRLKLLGGNVVLRKVVYALEPSDVLITGLNSFQTYSEAELVALSIPNMPGWDGADEQARIAALIEARLRINRLQFRDVSRGQSYLGGEALVGDLSLLAPREFKNLSARLRAALCKAQVAEADTLLGGDPESERRRSGLVHETVGESAQTWRASKPLELPVSRKALSYLSGFITMSRKVGRS